MKNSTKIHHLIFSRCLIYFMILALILVLFLSTNFSLWLGLSLMQWLLPGQLQVGEIQGGPLETIIVKDLKIKEKNFSFQAESLIFDWQFFDLFNHQLKLKSFYLKNAKLNLTDSSLPITVTQLKGSVEYDFQNQDFNTIEVKIRQLQGEYQQKALTGFGYLKLKSNATPLALGETRFTWGKNEFQLIPEIRASTATAPENFRWKLIYDNAQALQQSLQLKGQLTFAQNGELEMTLLPGKIKWLAPEQTHTLSYEGGKITGKWVDNSYQITCQMKENIQNQLNARLILSADQSLQGKIDLVLKDFKWIYFLLPQIARLDAKANLSAEVSGSLWHPVFHLKAEIPQAIFSLPAQHITPKEVKLSLKGDIPGRLFLKGQGSLHQAPFHFEGYYDLNPSNDQGASDMGSLVFSGENLRVYNTPEITLVASPDLKLSYSDNSLYIKGNIKIIEADIRLKEELKENQVSTDVVFTDESQASKASSLSIKPDIHLLIKEKFRFKGFNLNTNIFGKLHITRREDGLLAGIGRLTLKEGKYRLPSSYEGHISYGRLLFPPGTLLNDPLLDIRIAKKAEDLTDNDDSGIYVQGTLQKPNYQLYSSDPFQRGEVLKGLGFSNQTFGEDNSPVLSQAASMLNYSPVVSEIQTRFGLEELGIQKQESPVRTSRGLSTPGGTESYVVLGKSLNNRTYVQVLQGMLEPNTLVRLRYLLTPNLAIGLETGTEQHYGGDLSFSMERD